MDQDIRYFRDTDSEEQKFVSEHLQLVHYTLSKYLGRRQSDQEYEDMFQEGCIGLMLAYRRYDAEKGTTLVSFSIRMIRGYILHYLRDKMQIVKESRTARSIAKKIQESGMEKESLDKIQEHFGCRRTMAADALELIHLNFYNRVISLNELVLDTDGEIEVSDQKGAMDDTSLIDAGVEHFIQMLDPRSRKVLKGVIEGKSQTDIGKEIGVSQMHVSRIIKAIRIKASNHFQIEGVAI